jgi:hypothetical protein
LHALEQREAVCSIYSIHRASVHTPCYRTNFVGDCASLFGQQSSDVARANGEGSEPRQRKDRPWQSNYTVYVEGAPKLRNLYARTKFECHRKLRETIADRDGGLVFGSKNLTVAEFLT